MKKPLRICSSKLLRLLGASCLVLLGASCQPGSDALPGQEVVARYGSEVLLRQEVNYFTPPGVKGEDSARYAQQYVDDWLRARALNEAAAQALPNLEDRVAFLSRRYRARLIEHEYAQWLAQEEREQVRVTEKEVRTYYQEHPEEFASPTSYFQYFYVKTPLARQYKVVNLIRSKDLTQIEELVRWAEVNAVAYKLDSIYHTSEEVEALGEGFYFGNITKASTNTAYPYSHKEGDSTFYDFFRMLDIIEPGDPLPLSLCRDRIELMLQSQRKQELIKKTELRLLQAAKAAKKVEVYE
jgi:hypothetical protein